MPAYARLTADERRRQLVGIGLRMLTERPIHAVTVEEVARAAGISRGLLFHYFPSKRDYHAEVVRAAARRVLRATRPAGDPPRDIVTGYVGFLARRHSQYTALFRGGADAWIAEIHDATLDALTARVADAVGGTDARGTLVIRAWWAFTETLALGWIAEDRDSRELITLLLVTLDHMLVQ